MWCENHSCHRLASLLGQSQATNNARIYFVAVFHRKTLDRVYSQKMKLAFKVPLTKGKSLSLDGLCHFRHSF